MQENFAAAVDTIIAISFQPLYVYAILFTGEVLPYKF